MVEHIRRNVVTDHRAINDSGTLRVPLESAGGMAALFLKLSATNGAGGSATYGLRAAVTKIRVKTDSHTTIFEMSASDLYAITAIRDKVAPELSEGTGAGAVQTVRLPIRLSLGENDNSRGIDLSKCPDAVLEVDYTLVIDGGDGFVTKSLRLDVDILETENMAKPNYIGYVSASVAHNGLTKVQDPDKIPLRTAKDVVGLYAYAYKSGTADNALVSNIKVMVSGKPNPVVDSSFGDLQRSRQSLSGAIQTSYAPIWLAPGRETGVISKPFPGDEAELHLRELVADGAVRVIVERMG